MQVIVEYLSGTWCGPTSLSGSGHQTASTPPLLLVPHSSLVALTSCACQIWKTQMLRKCKFFAWLALHDQCWTSRRLHRHGLKVSDTSALGTQEVETLDHLLIDGVFSRETWLRTLEHILLPHLTPNQPISLATWWCSARKLVAKARRKGFDDFVWLVALEGAESARS
jgi:hypothetical protein